MNALGIARLVLAQVGPNPNAPTGGGAVNTDAASVPAIALRRWYGSLTLSSPNALPSRVEWLGPLAGLGQAWVALLVGLAALLLVAVLAQGPSKALGQLLDVAGLARLLSAGMARLRRSGRLVAILLGATVVSWTAWQAPLHNRVEKRDDLALLLKTKSRAEFANEQGVLAALTPLRDLLGLGDTMVLLVGAAAVVFKFSADRWGRFDAPPGADRPSVGGLTTLCWGGAGLYAMYRVASEIRELDGLEPLGGCLFVEVGVIPPLMALADGLLLAWVLVELRGSAISDEEEGFDVAGTVAMVPSAILGCLVGLPARYAANAAGLAFFHHLPATMGDSPWIKPFLKGWGLAWLQSGSLVLVGLVGAIAWSRGTWGGVLAGYGRMLRAEGGRLTGLLVFLAAGVGGVSALAYFAVLALPAQPWVLLAADSYAHYASLPLGLLGLASLVELGSRTRGATKDSRGIDQAEGMVFAEEIAA